MHSFKNKTLKNNQKEERGGEGTETFTIPINYAKIFRLVMKSTRSAFRLNEQNY